MREFFTEIFDDLPDAILSAASVAAFISFIAVLAMLGAGA